MERYQYIFLDLDGPVLDGKQKHYRCYRDIVEELGGQPVEIEKYWQEKRGGKNRKILAESFEDDKESLCEVFTEEWKKRIETREYLQYDILKPQVKPALNRLKSQSECLALVTMRNSRENLIWQLKALEIIGYFDEIIACSSMSNSTKCEEISKRFSKKDMVRSLVIGDTEMDIYTAGELGTDFIGIINGLRTEKIFEGYKAYGELEEFCL